MTTLTLRTIIEKDEKWYHGYVPALPGCHTQGKTIEETRKNLREAMSGYIKTLKEKNLPIPKDESFEAIETIQIDSLSHPLNT
ncbi:MAG: type II toxin-antitoxin system HicB family antitoxin [Patescibacteria group bacterium]|mgnify:CR=1 FL=1